jgi:MFS family permease
MTRAPTLGLFHCVYSMGAFTGAVVGGVIMDQKNSTVLKEVILFGLILLLPGLLLSAWLFSHQEEKLLTDLHAFQYQSLLSGAEAAQATANPIANGTKQQAEEEDMQPSVLRRMPTVTDNSTISSSQPLQASRSTVAVGGQAGQEWQVYGSEADTEANKPTHERSRLMERALIFCGCSSYIKLIPLAQIACLALLACFGEGAVNDWSVIYYTDSLNSSPLVSTVGFAGFELSIACGRYGSDYLVGLLGRQRLMMCSGLVACLGMCVVVLAPSLIDVHQHQVALEVVTTIGFSICGFGLSSLAPSAISLAGSAAITGAAGTTAAESIASVTSVSYLGIMLSPPFLGGMSVVLHSLRWSFAIAAGMIAPIALVALCIDKQVYDSYDQGMKPHEKAPVDEQDDRVVVLQA